MARTTPSPTTPPPVPGGPVDRGGDPARRLDADALEALAGTLLPPSAVDGAAHPDEPVLVLVTPTHDHLDVALRPAGGDPAVVLRGIVAPPGCRAAGVVAPAHLRPMPGDLDLEAAWPTSADDAGAVRRSARIAVLVDATGRVACAHTDDDLEAGSRSWCSAPDEPLHGRLLDALRRVVGLPTAAPPADTTVLWTALWLERLAADPPGSWAEARRRHPAAAVLPDLIGGVGGPDEALVEATEVLATLWSWGELRRALGRGDHDLAGVTPADATWFDDGAFARAVLEGVVSPTTSLAALARRLDPDVHHRVARITEAAVGGPGPCPTASHPAGPGGQDRP